MACSKRTSPTLLDGPDQYHVYMAYHPNDKQLYQTLNKQLEYENFIIYRKEKNLSRKENIEKGIELAQKVLFIMTKRYLADKQWPAFERRTAIVKSKIRQSKSIVLLLVDVKESSIQQELQGYETITYTTDDASSEHSKTELSRALSEDTLPQASCFPKYNMGYTLACSHFFGYLRFVLPELARRIDGDEILNSANGKISHKMFACIPESCQCPADLCKTEQAISSPRDIPFSISRGGILARDYKAVLYEVTDPQTKEIYRAVVEYPAVLNTLYDMIHDPMAGMTKEDRRRELHVLFFHLKSLLKQYNLQNTIKLVYIKDKGPPFLDMLITTVRAEIEKEENEKSKPSKGSDVAHITRSFSQMEIVKPCVKSQPLEDHIPSYQLSAKRRGKAIIINNKDFLPTSGLQKRNGAEHDLENMTKLFKRLKFDVIPHENLKSSEIKDVVAQLSIDDFSNDQALVICIMTHGKLGKIYGVDGGLVKITEITQDLASNDSLLRKPKLFFIQACQRGKEDAEATSPVINTSEDLAIKPQTDSRNRSSASSESEETVEDSAMALPNTTEVAKKKTNVHQTSKAADGSGSDNGDEKDVQRKTLQLRIKRAETETPLSPVQPIFELSFPKDECKPATNLQCVGPYTGTEVDADDNEEISRADLVPGAPDFFMSYSTLPGALSYRHHEIGCLYVKSLCENMQKYDQQQPLDRILMRVSTEIKDLFKSEANPQYPFFVQTCDRLVYLK